MQKNNREVYKLESGYFHLEFIDSHFYHADCANETMASVECFLEENDAYDIPFLITAKNSTPKMSFEARRIFASDVSLRRYSCVAIVTQNHLHHLISSLFMAMNNSKVPIKLFTNKVKALEWFDEKSIIKS